MHVDTIKRYHCTTCDVEIRLQECEYDDYGGEYVCPHCNNFHIEVYNERPAEWFSVAVYEVHNAYGGPEEGGWYYDAGTRVDETVRIFYNTTEGREEADRYLESLLALKYKRPMQRHYLRPYTTRVFAEALPDANFPRRCPVYC